LEIWKSGNLEIWEGTEMKRFVMAVTLVFAGAPVFAQTAPAGVAGPTRVISSFCSALIM
jgi:hypothetical protein